MTIWETEKDFWTKYADVYDILLALNSYRALMADVLKAADIKEGMRIGDFGCGTGNFLMTLLKEFGRKVKCYGYDLSPEMIFQAGQKVRGAGYQLEQIDIGTNPDMGMLFDRIICVQVLYSLPDPEVAIRMMKRHLAPEGKLVLVNPDQNSFMGLILMAHLDKRPKDIERWKTNDLNELLSLGEEVFGDVSMVEIAQTIEDDDIRQVLLRFKERRALDVMGKLLAMNVEIVRRAQEGGTYHFTTHKQICELLSKVGFCLSYEGKTYGEQCHLVVA